jgi:hypothetical protein
MYFLHTYRDMYTQTHTTKKENSYITKYLSLRKYFNLKEIILPYFLEADYKN